MKLGAVPRKVLIGSYLYAVLKSDGPKDVPEAKPAIVPANDNTQTTVTTA
ncbi:hypothetical protein [Mesorhizobium sp. M1322]